MMVALRATIPFMMKSRPELVRELLDYEVRLAILMIPGLVWKVRGFRKGRDVFKKLLL